ncbi:embryo-specific protein ATS3A [Trifolium repens]|nr:embryo-specific protein ATS3A [Trifolium repens]
MELLKNKTGHFLFCFVLLHVLVAGCESLEAPQKKICTYVITIETTCTWGAETSNRVSLRFGDTNSSEILVRQLNSKHLRQVDPLEPEVLDDIPRKPFQACTVDQFTVTASPPSVTCTSS